MNEQPLYFRITVKLFLLMLVVVVLVVAKDFLVPLTIAIFFTFLLLPVSQKLERWKFPRTLAIIISITVAMAVFAALLYFFYWQAISFADDWPQLKQKFTEKTESIYQYIRENFNVSKKEQKNWINTKISETAESSDEIVLGIFSATGAFLASFALIPIYIFFLTFYRTKFKEFICLVTKNDKPDHILNVVSKVTRVSQKYLKGIFLDVLILSVLNSTGFLLLGLKHAVLFGVLAAILNIIPYIGVLIGSILPVIMALLTKDELSYAIGAMGVCVFVQFLDNNFITPYVVGSSVSINPLTAIIVLILSAFVWGIPGMVLSLPLTGMLKVICDHIESLKPYGFLIGEEINYRDKEHFQDKFFKRPLKSKNKA
jgi:predicted PurR-regulated permease PerM